MKVVGLITEYNPFHNGHRLHLQEAKRITKADKVVVVMSGNFVQRGTPALIDKYQRTRFALEEGADVIIELPTCYATASAEGFALGAVSLLQHIQVIDDLCFGSESGDIEGLNTIAKLFLHESQEFKEELTLHLRSGLTYPAARHRAFMTCYPDVNSDISSLLSSPNNILGIEYLKAINLINSSIIPYTITRQISGYHDTELNHPITSATAIRKSLKDKNPISVLFEHVPESVYTILEKEHLHSSPIFEDDFSEILQYKLMLESYESLLQYQDMSDAIARRILQYNNDLLSFSNMALALKTRDITLTRVNRSLLHILLDMKKDSYDLFNNQGYTQYARLLGFRKESSSLIRKMQDNSTIPIITKLSNGNKLLSSTGKLMLEQDILASNLYNIIVHHKYNHLLKNEFLQGVVIL